MQMVLHVLESLGLLSSYPLYRLYRPTLHLEDSAPLFHGLNLWSSQGGKCGSSEQKSNTNSVGEKASVATRRIVLFQDNTVAETPRRMGRPLYGDKNRGGRIVLASQRFAISQ
jgi:hypothetical protein